MSWISIGGSLSGIYRIADVTFQAPFLVSMDFHSLLRTLKLHCESDGIMSSIFTMEDSMRKNQSTGGRTIPANIVAFGKIWIWDINYSLLWVFPVRSGFCCHGFMLRCILEPDIFSRLFLSLLLKFFQLLHQGLCLARPFGWQKRQQHTARAAANRWLCSGVSLGDKCGW